MVLATELEGLPDDDELALLLFEERCANTMRQESNEEDWSAEREFVVKILAFIDESDLQVRVDRSPPNDDPNFSNWFREFRSDLDYWRAQIQIRQVRGKNSGIVKVISFTEDYREEIHGLLEKIRRVVNSTELSVEKKDAIYGKLAALQLEVDRSKTRFDALLSRMLDFTNAVGDGADNLKPLANLTERLMKVLGRAKSDLDMGLLPSPDETKKLAAPDSVDEGD